MVPKLYYFIGNAADTNRQAVANSNNSPIRKRKSQEPEAKLAQPQHPLYQPVSLITVAPEASFPQLFHRQLSILKYPMRPPRRLILPLINGYSKFTLYRVSGPPLMSTIQGPGLILFL